MFLTLVLETIGIATYNKIKNKGKVLFIVTIANIVSFILPYVERAYRHMPTSGTWFWAWHSAFAVSYTHLDVYKRQRLVQEHTG